MFRKRISCAHQSKAGKKIILFPARGRRTLKGSLSVEAAIALPLFMMFCAALISFIVIYFVQINLQTGMDETARILGKAAYLAEHEIENSSLSGNAYHPGQSELSVSGSGINSASIKFLLQKNENYSGAASGAGICGGSSGIDTGGSSYDTQTGILDILIRYDYSVPWVPDAFGRLHLTQRMKTHVWTGRSLTDGSDAGAGTEDDNSSETKVYITPTGTVYHLSPSCNYLDLSIHAENIDSIGNARNASGAKYHKCPLCTGNNAGNIAYITDYGTDWHLSLSCSGLKRTVMETDLSDVGDMKLCSKCKNAEHDHD